MIGFDAVNLEHAAAGGRAFGTVEGLEAHRIEEPLETFEYGFLHDHPPPNQTVAAILARRESIDHPSWEAGNLHCGSLLVNVVSWLHEIRIARSEPGVLKAREGRSCWTRGRID